MTGHRSWATWIRLPCRSRNSCSVPTDGGIPWGPAALVHHNTGYGFGGGNTALSSGATQPGCGKTVKVVSAFSLPLPMLTV